MIAQVWIVLFGASAIWLSMSPKPKVARWGCICGLLSQPAWFYETYTQGQWGIFAISFVYAASWLRGVNTHWLSGVKV
jgi:hypothetical protein